MLPKAFPPHSMARRHFHDWRDSGLWQTINHVLLMDVREQTGCAASQSAGVIGCHAAACGFAARSGPGRAG